jgi:hypothetical protein
VQFNLTTFAKLAATVACHKFGMSFPVIQAERRRRSRPLAATRCTVDGERHPKPVKGLLLELDERGARLELADGSLPTETTLRLSTSGHDERGARVVWRKGRQMGLELLPPKIDLPPQD